MIRFIFFDGSREAIYPQDKPLSLLAQERVSPAGSPAMPARKRYGRITVNDGRYLCLRNKARDYASLEKSYHSFRDITITVRFSSTYPTTPKCFAESARGLCRKFGLPADAVDVPFVNSRQQNAEFVDTHHMYEDSYEEVRLTDEDREKMESSIEPDRRLCEHARRRFWPADAAPPAAAW